MALGWGCKNPPNKIKKTNMGVEKMRGEGGKKAETLFGREASPCGNLTRTELWGTWRGDRRQASETNTGRSSDLSWSILTCPRWSRPSPPRRPAPCPARCPGSLGRSRSGRCTWTDWHTRSDSSTASHSPSIGSIWRTLVYWSIFAQSVDIFWLIF